MNQENNSEPQFLDDQEFDHFFKSQLEHHQVEPDHSNWSAIKRWHPLKSLFNISKYTAFQIAASLLFVLTASTIFLQLPIIEQHPGTIGQAASTPADIDTLSEIQKLIPQSDFVLDIQNEQEAEDLEVRKELIDKELDDYLAFLFEDEDEFASNVDSSEISEYLRPAEQLPIDEMFAVIPDFTDQEEITILAPLETKITLPHRFVSDEKEIEAYLLLYEINKLRN